MAMPRRFKNRWYPGDSRRLDGLTAGGPVSGNGAATAQEESAQRVSLQESTSRGYRHTASRSRASARTLPVSGDPAAAGATSPGASGARWRVSECQIVKEQGMARGGRSQESFVICHLSFVIGQWSVVSGRCGRRWRGGRKRGEGVGTRRWSTGSRSAKFWPGGGWKTENRGRRTERQREQSGHG